MYTFGALYCHYRQNMQNNLRLRHRHLLYPYHHFNTINDLAFTHLNLLENLLAERRICGY